MPLAHPFLYPPPRTPDDPIQIVPARDSEANGELRAAVQNLGYRPGTTVLNLPPEQRSYRLLPPAEQRVVELPFLGPNDILLCTTRPPLSDFIINERKKVEPSGSTLEAMIFRHYFRYFDRCSRSSIKFTEQAMACLPQGKKNRAVMGFYQLGCAYSGLGETEKHLFAPGRLRGSTAAFLLSVDELWPGGPGFKAAWGLNAIATLVWNFLLRDRYSALLEHKGLTVVEMKTSEVPPRPNTYSWSRDWDVTPLMTTDIELPERPRKIQMPWAPEDDERILSL